MNAGEEPLEFRYEKLRGSKRMLIMAKDSLGVAFWRLCSEEMTFTAEVYCQFLDNNIGNWMAARNVKKAIIAHDNAKPHAPRIAQQFFEEKVIETWI
ncbi:unnamed protein product [Haemonchus placei]|uniref:Histone-lysine N-methyltransferase SETMAR n=1 Tax=Haemonchus placei TaxID=6290 RepID=A0A0N4WUX7_HAEPC|nr:unnamed protein product [Haemonchus placei]